MARPRCARLVQLAQELFWGYRSRSRPADAARGFFVYVLLSHATLLYLYAEAERFLWAEVQASGT